MGTAPYDGGIAFRVWAPHAERVCVTGTFNNWSKDANPLNGEGDGYWSAEIPGVKSGDQYKYIIINQDREILRNDPYARAVTNSMDHR